MSSVIFNGVDALVKKGVYSTKDELIDDALRTFFEFRKDLRVTAVVELYKNEEMSISKASELAGVSTEEMKDFLVKGWCEDKKRFFKK